MKKVEALPTYSEEQLTATKKYVCMSCNKVFANEISQCPDCAGIVLEEIVQQKMDTGKKTENISQTPQKNNYTVIAVVLLVAFVLFAFPKSVSIEYDGCWSGAIADSGGAKSIDGCGNESFTCYGLCSANAQKQDGGNGKLCVKTLFSEECTTSAYGVASV